MLIRTNHGYLYWKIDKYGSSLAYTDDITKASSFTSSEIEIYRACIVANNSPVDVEDIQPNRDAIKKIEKQIETIEQEEKIITDKQKIHTENIKEINEEYWKNVNVTRKEMMSIKDQINELEEVKKLTASLSARKETLASLEQQMIMNVKEEKRKIRELQSELNKKYSYYSEKQELKRKIKKLEDDDYDEDVYDDE